MHTTRNAMHHQPHHRTSWKTRTLPISVLILFLCLAGPPVSAQRQRTEVIGYFPSWKWAQGDHAMTPQTIPYGKLTFINYAFFVPLPDGRIEGKDTLGDARYIRGDRNTGIVGTAHRHGVGVVLSIGGWEDSGNFPAVASTAELRTAFAHSCLDAMRTYGFDGIDIDWEYPGYPGHGGSPADRRNFTLLLQTLRDSLHLAAPAIGRPPVLTAALPAGGAQASGIDVRSIAGYLDYLNIMTYDFYGAWDPGMNHNSPLFPSAGADKARCVDAAFRYYRDSCGIPPGKINLGVPFYGRTYTMCRGLNQSHGGPDTVHFDPRGAVYSEIARKKNSFIRCWDTLAHVPYLIDSAWEVTVSYDDEESVREKALYVLDHRAGGLIIWELTGDMMDDGSTPLLTVIDATVNFGNSHHH